MRIGYARVSTSEQSIDRQLDLLAEHKCEKIFEEVASGIDSEREQLNQMMNFVRDGDTVVVESVSRISRSVGHLLSIVHRLQDKKVEFISLKESIDTTTPTGKFMMTVFGALSQLEREQMKLRQREGIEAARRRGKHLGRPKVDKPKNFDSVVAKWQNGQISGVQAQRDLSLNRATFYRMVAMQKKDSN